LNPIEPRSWIEVPSDGGRWREDVLGKTEPDPLTDVRDPAGERLNRLVTECGLAQNIKSILPKPLALGLVGLLFFANRTNIRATLAAMGAAERWRLAVRPSG